MFQTLQTSETSIWIHAQKPVHEIQLLFIHLPFIPDDEFIRVGAIKL
jgi:hypothetical protein